MAKEKLYVSTGNTLLTQLNRDGINPDKLFQRGSTRKLLKDTTLVESDFNDPDLFTQFVENGVIVEAEVETVEVVKPKRGKKQEKQEEPENGEE